jgi:hypothetical protein
MTRWVVIVVVVMVALLAFPFARHKWVVSHATCTTANLAIDFGPGAYEDGSAERWAEMSRNAQEGCPPGQWDRSKIDITKI